MFSRKHISLSFITLPGSSKKVSGEDLPDLPRVEVIRRLRERSEPILVFGESEADAMTRLRDLEVNEPEKVEGIRNDFK